MKRQIRKFSKFYNDKSYIDNIYKYRIKKDKEKIILSLQQKERLVIDKLAEEFQCSEKEVLLKGLYILLDNYLKVKYPSLKTNHNSNKRVKYSLSKELKLDKKMKDFINKTEEISIPLEFLL